MFVVEIVARVELSLAVVQNYADGLNRFAKENSFPILGRVNSLLDSCPPLRVQPTIREFSARSRETQFIRIGANPCDSRCGWSFQKAHLRGKIPRLQLGREGQEAR